MRWIAFRLALSCAGFSSWASHASSDPPLPTLEGYYANVSSGAILPSPDHPLDRPQDYFTVDVDRWNANWGARDFLDSKFSFYGRLRYLTKTQRHEAPYRYLNSWRSLSHPPIKHLTLPLSHYYSGFSGDPSVHENQAFFSPEFQKSLDDLSGTELTFGNTLTLLPNDSSFRAKLSLIRRATRTLWVSVMVYFCDSSTRALMQEMVNAKERGVDVKMILEGLYAKTAGAKCMKELSHKGISVLAISEAGNPSHFTSIMHNKFWIRDLDEAILGGQNMHEFSNYSDGFNNLNRDTDVSVRGPAVSDLSEEFILLWKRYQGSDRARMEDRLVEVRNLKRAERANGSRGESYYSNILASDSRMNGVCRVLVQGAGATRHAIAPVIDQYLERANTQVLFTTPSLRFEERGGAWNDRLADRLLALARNRHVQIEAISNGIEGGSGDMSNFLDKLRRLSEGGSFFGGILRSITGWIQTPADLSAAKKDWKYLTSFLGAPSIRAWQYFEFIHAKQWLIDRTATIIGSFNLDLNSATLNHETAILCLDRSLESQLERQLTLDLLNSTPVVAR